MRGWLLVFGTWCCHGNPLLSLYSKRQRSRCPINPALVATERPMHSARLGVSTIGSPKRDCRRFLVSRFPIDECTDGSKTRQMRHLALVTVLALTSALSCLCVGTRQGCFGDSKLGSLETPDPLGASATAAEASLSPTYVAVEVGNAFSLGWVRRITRSKLPVLVLPLQHVEKS